MATKKLHIAQGLAVGSNFRPFSEVEPAVANLSPAAGWRYSTGNTRGNENESNEINAAAISAVTDWILSPTQPLAPNNTKGNGAVSPEKYTGTFVPGEWPWGIICRTVTNGTGSFRLRCRMRLWRSSDITGAGAVEITNPLLEEEITTLSPNSTGVNANFTLDGSWPCPGFSMQDEYLIMTLAAVIGVHAAASATRDLYIRAGAGSYLQTTDFIPGSAQKYGVGRVPIK